jgi:tRNA (guanine-N7-)-methyltransferase
VDGVAKESRPTAIYKPGNYLEPLDWHAVFGREAPVEIDVGCGKGNFLAWAARARLDHNFLGVDRQLVRLRKVDKKVQRHALSNVRLLRLEFSYLISKLIPDTSVAAYYIFFPDPWPKRRHAAKRLFQEAFVTELHRTLCKTGVVNVATDDAPYFAQITGLMNANVLFRSEAVEILPEEAQTEFEKIFLAKGHSIHRARWRKQA